MTKRPLLIMSLIPAMMLAGCMGTENRGLESVHQPVVSRADYAIDLAVSGTTLARGERDRLAGWMNGVQVRYGDQVTVDDPSGIAMGAYRQVADVVESFGLLLSATQPVTATPVSPGAIRVIVSRMRAEVPGCPDFSRNSSFEYDSNTSSNQGCAVNSNLAAMVARPADLVIGKAKPSVLTPVTANKAIEAFRKAAPGGSAGAAAGGGK